MTNYTKYMNDPNETVKPDEYVKIFYNSGGRKWHIFQKNGKKCLCKAFKIDQFTGQHLSKTFPASEILDMSPDIRGSFCTQGFQRLETLVEAAKENMEVME